MRVSFSRHLVFAFAGAVGLTGSAFANPDGPLPWHKEGTPPPRVLRTDITLRVAHDGRADSRDQYVPQRDSAFNDPAQTRFDNRYEAQRPFALPIRADIKNRVNMCDCQDHASHDKGSHQATADNHRDSRPSTYREPSHVAPIPIQSRILLRLEQASSEGREVGVKANDHRAAGKKQQKMGDADQADLLNARAIAPSSGKVMTPAQMFSRVQLHRGGSSDQSDEK